MHNGERRQRRDHVPGDTRVGLLPLGHRLPQVTGEPLVHLLRRATLRLVQLPADLIARLLRGLDHVHRVGRGVHLRAPYADRLVAVLGRACDPLDRLGVGPDVRAVPTAAELVGHDPVEQRPGESPTLRPPFVGVVSRQWRRHVTGVCQRGNILLLVQPLALRFPDTQPGVVQRAARGKAHRREIGQHVFLQEVESDVAHAIHARVGRPDEDRLRYDAQCQRLDKRRPAPPDEERVLPRLQQAYALLRGGSTGGVDVHDRIVGPTVDIDAHAFLVVQAHGCSDVDPALVGQLEGPRPRRWRPAGHAQFQVLFPQQFEHHVVEHTDAGVPRSQGGQRLVMPRPPHGFAQGGPVGPGDHGCHSMGARREGCRLERQRQRRHPGLEIGGSGLDHLPLTIDQRDRDRRPGRQRQQVGQIQRRQHLSLQVVVGAVEACLEQFLQVEVFDALAEASSDFFRGQGFGVDGDLGDRSLEEGLGVGAVPNVTGNVLDVGPRQPAGHILQQDTVAVEAEPHAVPRHHPVGPLAKVHVAAGLHDVGGPSGDRPAGCRGRQQTRVVPRDRAQAQTSLAPSVAVAGMAGEEGARHDVHPSPPLDRPRRPHRRGEDLPTLDAGPAVEDKGSGLPPYHAFGRTDNDAVPAVSADVRDSLAIAALERVADLQSGLRLGDAAAGGERQSWYQRAGDHPCGERRGGTRHGEDPFRWPPAMSAGLRGNLWGQTPYSCICRPSAEPRQLTLSPWTSSSSGMSARLRSAWGGNAQRRSGRSEPAVGAPVRQAAPQLSAGSTPGGLAMGPSRATMRQPRSTTTMQPTVRQDTRKNSDSELPGWKIDAMRHAIVPLSCRSTRPCSPYCATVTFWPSPLPWIGCSGAIRCSAGRAACTMCSMS